MAGKDGLVGIGGDGGDGFDGHDGVDGCRMSSLMAAGRTMNDWLCG